MILNGCFIVGSLGIITLGASISALYSVTLQWAKQKEVDVIKDFFKSYRSNFKQATLITLILLFFGSMMLFNIFLFGKSGQRFFDIYQWINVFLLLLLILIFLFIYPMIAQFENTISNYFKNSILMIISNPTKTLLIILVIISILFISLYNQTSFAISLGFFIIIGFATVARWLSIYFSLIFKQTIKE